MRVALYLAALLLGATASPNGYYHQQYNYKTSSSSYKNNELQHKTDDQGYYSKNGDLEGRVKPKVSSNSEHSEYINPQLREGLNAGYYDAGTELTSHGNMLANSYGSSVGGGVSTGYNGESHYGSDRYSEGMASSDHIGGATGVYGVYGSGSSHTSYGSSSLSTIASRLQNDLQHEIQNALRSQSQYSHQTDISELEAELRRNLTARLNEILQEQYGTQTIRGGQSYSLTGGRLQTRPNYEQRDLENLQRQIENSLLYQLRTSSHQTNSQNYARYESTTTYRPTTYRNIYPNLNVITTQRPFPEYPGRSKDSYYSQQEYNANRVSSNNRYTPVPNPLSITTIASQVQSQLDSQLNRLLEQAQRQYFSENSGYSVYNTDSILEKLKQELRSNLTYKLDEELRNQYGTQVQKNNHMFSVGSGGEISSQYNYDINDLENLRRQVENNLLTKLSRDFETARQRWISRERSQQNSYGHSESSQYQYGSSSSDHYGASNNQRFIYSTPRTSDDDYYRPTSASIVPLISTGVKGTQYHGVSGSHQSSYGMSGSSSIAELQRQLQADLSRQLQAAITQNKAYSTRYSTSGGYGGTFEEAYQRLYDDLQRNLTQQLQEFESGGSSYSTSYGSVSDAQLASLKAQLQRNLASQLQQGLQQSYSASASYSASSGSSASAGAGAYSSSSSGGSYRATRGSDDYQTAKAGFSGYGQYRSGGSYHLEGEDCQGDDPSAYHSHRAKRSYGYRSRPLGLSTYSGSAYAGRGNGEYNTGYHGNLGGYGSTYGRSTYEQQPLHNVGQVEDDSDLQQVEEGFTGQQEIDVGQQVDDFDDTQQVKVDNDFGTIEVESQVTPQNSRRQQVGDQFRQSIYKPSRQSTRDDSHGTQLGFQTNVGQTLNRENHLTLPLENVQSQIQLGQEVDDSDLVQQVEDTHYDYQLGFQKNVSQKSNKDNHLTQSLENVQSQVQVGQEVDDSDLVQQVEDTPYNHQLGLQSNVGQNFNRNNHLTQSLENVYSQIQVGQKVDDSDLIQQVEKPNYDKLGFRRTVSQKLSDVNHLTPPVERVQSQNQIGQEIDDSDLTQQVEDTHYGHHLGYQSNVGQTPINGNHLTHSLEKVQSQIQVGQKVDDSDLVQQFGDTNYETSYNPENNRPFSSGANFETIVAGASLSNSASFASPISSTTQRSTTRALQAENIYLHDTETPDSRSSIRSTTKKTILTVESNYNNKANLNQKNGHSSFNYEPLGQELDDSDIESVTLQHQKTTKFPHTDVYTSNAVLVTKPLSQFSLQALDLPNEVSDISKQIETKLTKQLESTLKTDINHATSASQQYQNILVMLQKNIDTECNKLIKDNSYANIDQSDVNKLHEYLNNKLKEKLQHFIFSGENYGISSLNHGEESSFDNKYTDFGHSLNYEEGNRYQYSGGYVLKPTHSQDFIQREIHSQSNVNNRPIFTDNQPNLLQIPNGGIVNSPTKPFTTNVVNGKPKVHEEWEIEEPDYVPIQTPKQVVINSKLNENTAHGTNNKWVNNGTPEHLPTIPFNYKPVNYEQNNFSSTTEKVTIAITPNTSQPYFFDFKNFPPLPLPDYKPQREISQAPSLSQTSTGRNINSDTFIDRQNIEQLINAEREADLLIERLRVAQQNRAQSSYQQGRTESYESQYDSTSYHHRQSVQNSPNQYEIIQVKLENITPNQLKIINQIDEDFVKIIDLNVQNEIEAASSSLSSYENYQESIKKLERELKSNLAYCIDGNIQQSIGNLEQNLGKYSTLIYANFEANKILDLHKYLEIKLLKILRQKLKKAYNIETDENNYEFLNSPKIQPHETYEYSTGYEVTQVKLENLTQNQLNIINKINHDLSEQIDMAIQDHVSSVSLSYLSSKENYQNLLNKLENELKHNISECVHAATEPGLSKYSDLIVGSFDQDKIVKLEQYLQINLIKTLRKKLISHFKIGTTYSFNSNLNSDSDFYNSGNNPYQSRSHYGIQYAHTNNFNLATEKTLEITPVESQHAGVVVPVSYSDGVKGRRPILENPAESQPNVNLKPEKNELTTNLDETAEPTTEKVGWWKRFGNKVKQGAANLKEKIVGKS